MTALAVAALGGCALPDRGDPPLSEVDTAEVKEVDSSPGDSLDETAEVDTAEPPVSFADGVHQFLVANCTAAGCHSSAAGGYSIIDDLEADYEATLREIVVGDALASKLVKKSTGTSSHTGGPVLQEGTAEYDLVIEWINDGANP